MTAVHETIDSFPDVSERLALPNSHSITKGSGNLIHLLSGGISGTVAVIVTCPLEVVKTRFQSSVYTSLMRTVSYTPHCTCSASAVPATSYLAYEMRGKTSRTLHSFLHKSPSGGFSRIWWFIGHIVKTEGILGLFRGFGPTVIGVAPHKAIYFHVYANSKQLLAPYLSIDSPSNHLLSSGCASFTAATFTNPIWFVKTRLQLDSRRERQSTFKLIRDVYRLHGIRGFYRGVTASYYGVSETMIYFVLYERLRLSIGHWRGMTLDEDRRMYDFLIIMMASAVCKSTACCLAYPHEVARTRLREESGRYRRFWQTLRLVHVEEGISGLYRGLFTALIRQIPNAAISMATYETVSYYLRSRTMLNDDYV